MSMARRNRRVRSRQAQKHFAVLGELLTGFYELLEKQEKPSDQEVRAEFVAREKSWKHYCSRHQLTESASLLFNSEVQQSWESRYSKQPEILS